MILDELGYETGYVISTNQVITYLSNLVTNNFKLVIFTAVLYASRN